VVAKNQTINEMINNTMLTSDELAALPLPLNIEQEESMEVRDILIHHMDLLHFEHHLYRSQPSDTSRMAQRQAEEHVQNLLANVMHIGVTYCGIPEPTTVRSQYTLFDAVRADTAAISAVDTDLLPVIIAMLVLGKWHRQISLSPNRNIREAFVDKYSVTINHIKQLKNEQ
jgi:hypothetical protein